MYRYYLVCLSSSVDTTPPVVQFCPTDITQKIETGIPSLPIYWSPPKATDLSGNATLISQTHQPGNEFKAGLYDILYSFADGSGNEAICMFLIIVEEGTTLCRIYILGKL